jgi:hypothetical protein
MTVCMFTAELIWTRHEDRATGIYYMFCMKLGRACASMQSGVAPMLLSLGMLFCLAICSGALDVNAESKDTQVEKLIYCGPGTYLASTASPWCRPCRPGGSMGHIAAVLLCV